MEELSNFKTILIKCTLIFILFLTWSIFSYISVFKGGIVDSSRGTIQLFWIAPTIFLISSLVVMSFFTKRFRVTRNDEVEKVRIDQYKLYVWLIPLIGPWVYYSKIHKKLSSIQISADVNFDKSEEEFKAYVKTMASNSKDKDAKFWNDVQNVIEDNDKELLEKGNKTKRSGKKIK